jgi:hypothetical protein
MAYPGPLLNHERKTLRAAVSNVTMPDGRACQHAPRSIVGASPSLERTARPPETAYGSRKAMKRLIG